jgi:hypothetical protein
MLTLIRSRAFRERFGGLGVLGTRTVMASRPCLGANILGERELLGRIRTILPQDRT